MSDDEHDNIKIAQDLLASADDKYERHEWDSLGTTSGHSRVYAALRAIANHADD